MFQSWQELMFAHWRVPMSALRSLVPPQLEIEEFDGSAWVGLTPFRVTDLHPRFLPAIPGLSSFPELNLRTYVRTGGKSGIYFFSLDAANRLAVVAARATYQLPYYPARMSMQLRSGWVHYESSRASGSAEFRGRYRPTGPVFNPQPGTLEHFLTERYALFAVFAGGHVLLGEIHHDPWPLQIAEAVIEQNTVGAAAGVDLTGQPATLHYSARQDTLIWRPVTVAGYG
jgi:uncharacterized protein